MSHTLSTIVEEVCDISQTSQTGKISLIRTRHLRYRTRLQGRPAGGPEERRKAAEWAYDESIGNRLFNQGLALAGQESPLQERRRNRSTHPH